MSGTRLAGRSLAAALALLFGGLAAHPLAGQSLRLPERSPGAVDDSERFASAVARLRSTGLDTLLVPPGQYRLTAGETGAHWLLEDLNDVVVVGTGATLLLGSLDAPGIVIRDCDNVTVEGLTLDWDPLPWLAGRVMQVTERRTRVTLRLDTPLPPGYADGFNRAKERWATAWTEGGERILESLDPIVIGDIEIDGSHVTVELPRPLSGHSGVQEGKFLLLVGRNPQAHAFVVRQSTGVTIEGNSVWSAPGMAIVAQDRNVGTTIRGNQIRPPPESRRFISTNADGIHVIGPLGTTVIENNLVSSAQDDAIVVSQRGVRVRISSDAGSFTLTERRTVQMRPGDDVQGLLPSRGLVSLGQLRQVVTEDGQPSRFTTSCIETDTCPEMRRGFEFPVFFVPQTPSSVEIRGNVIYNIRGRGIRINASHVRVERNIVMRTTGAQVMLGAILRDRWVPQAPAVDVELSYNSFVDRTLPGEAERRQATIDIENRPSSGSFGGMAATTDIAIRNNTFMVQGNHGLFANDAGTITISGNRFHTTAVRSGRRGQAAVVLREVERAEIMSNTFFFAGPGSEDATAVFARPVRARTELRLSGNQMYLNGASQPRDRIWEARGPVRVLD